MTEKHIRQLLGGTKILGAAKDLNHLAEPSSLIVIVVELVKGA